MIHIFFLAAGNSTRFGSNKLLTEFRGKPLFLHGMTVLQSVAEENADCSLHIVSRYAPILDRAAAWDIHAIDSPQSERGISYSIRAGLESLRGVDAADYFLFVLADQPLLTKEGIQRMLQAARSGCTAATSCYERVPGSPTLFSAKLREQLLELEGDQGGRSVLKTCDDVVWVEMPCAAELFDVDRPEDLQKANVSRF